VSDKLPTVDPVARVERRRDRDEHPVPDAHRRGAPWRNGSRSSNRRSPSPVR
jgi:hypothetical protein